MRIAQAFRAAIGVMVLIATPALSQTSAEPPAAIQGYDPVAYFTESKPVKGLATIYQDFDGRRYYFANPKHKSMFLADPDRYIPQFGANCAVAVSRGRILAGNPLYWAIVDDRLYLFAAAWAAESVKKDPGMLAKGRAHWTSMRK